MERSWGGMSTFRDTEASSHTYLLNVVVYINKLNRGVMVAVLYRTYLTLALYVVYGVLLYLENYNIISRSQYCAI